MQEAAVVGAVSLERISFKGCLDTVRQYVPALGSKRSPSRIRALYLAMLNAIARDQVPFGQTEENRAPSNADLKTTSSSLRHAMSFVNFLTAANTQIELGLNYAPFRTDPFSSELKKRGRYQQEESHDH